ncbi:MAG: biotin/lipoyl-containing protein, partial [Spirochaetales bacterium]
MATAVLMPQLGLTMTEGLIMEWKKHEGEIIKKGEVLFDVENDKATIDVEAQADGVLAKIIIAEKVTVPVGTVVGYIAAAGEKIADQVKLPPQSASVHSANQTAPAEESAQTSFTEADHAFRGKTRSVKLDDGFVLASPFARKAAESQRIDLTTLSGTGPGGAVIGRDLPMAEAGVMNAAVKPAVKLSAPVSNGTYVDISLSRIGKIAAERMNESWTTIPQFTLYDEADADVLLRLSDRYKKEGQSVSLTAILAKLLAHAAQAYPL